MNFENKSRALTLGGKILLIPCAGIFLQGELLLTGTLANSEDR